jgi:GTP-sensing pleiotropic transcriptional regulator CodY
MTIQFHHKGKKVKGRIVYSESVNDVMIVFPESNLGELGWSHFFQKKENKWTSETFLKDKYPDTYSSLLLQLNSLANNLETNSAYLLFNNSNGLSGKTP